MKRRILLVEDNPMDAVLAREALSVHAITHVETLSAAMAALGDGYDVVLLDIALPDAQGTAGIRALRGAQAPPVIMLSGNLDPDLEQAVVHFGAASFFVKGFTEEDELEDAIQNACIRQSLPRNRESGLLSAEGLLQHAKDQAAVSLAVMRMRPHHPGLMGLLGEKLARVVPAECGLGHVGPNEFAMLFGASDAADQLAGMASDHLQRPVEVAGEIMSPICVLGVAAFFGDGEACLELARRAAADAEGAQTAEVN